MRFHQPFFLLSLCLYLSTYYYYEAWAMAHGLGIHEAAAQR